MKHICQIIFKTKSKTQVNLISPWPIVAIAHKALRFSRSKMAAAWKNFKTAMKEKRTGKKGGLGNDILPKQAVVIQRLSAEVSGKAQKYSRIGPREFVPYEYDEVTLANIKIACKKHFASRIGDEMLCDVLTGEQGPSCSSLDQIPDMRVVHIRFIEPVQSSEHEAAVHVVQGIKRRQETLPKSEPSPRKKKSCISEMVPKSLSVVEMLKLGKVIHDKSTRPDITTRHNRKRNRGVKKKTFATQVGVHGITHAPCYSVTVTYSIRNDTIICCDFI